MRSFFRRIITVITSVTSWEPGRSGCDGYRPREGATFVRNPGYWGPKALPDRIEFKFYSDIQPRLLALQAGEVDILDAVPVFASPAIRSNPDIKILQVRSANHRQLHMRCDVAPFTDKRVRQAVALSLDRKKLVDGLCRGMGVMGNDSPFTPLFPSTDPTVPQRNRDIAKAKQLMEAAGVAAGFDVTLTTERYTDIPEYAQLVQNFAKEIGIRIGLKVETQALYYGKSIPRPVRLARQYARHHGLRASRRAEYLARQSAAEQRTLECRAFQQRSL